jgi:hypothetical protein
MSEMFRAALAQLRAIDPVLPAALLITFVLLTIYTVRKFFPRAWLWVERTVPYADSIDPGPGLDALWKAWQAWPAMALGAAISALFAGVSVRHALWGVFCGLISALSHTIAAAYKGKVGELKPKDPSPPAASLVGVLCFAALCFALGGCAIFGAHGSFWPKVEKCAPSPASLVSQVADILVAGGDYEAALKALALQDGAAAVICAVQAFVSSTGHKFGAGPEELSGVARGKAFLTEHPVNE